MSETMDDHTNLVQYGIDAAVAQKLMEIFETGKLAYADLDERVLDALKEFPVEEALDVLKQFVASNLEHVSNKSAYLCGVMKMHGKKQRPQGTVKADEKVKVFCGKIPKDVTEDELQPLFEKYGTIWDFRLMMDPVTRLNRGYAFITYTSREAALETVKNLNDYEIRKGKKLGVTISHTNNRLFVGNIPKNQDRDELFEEFAKHAPGLVEVIIYSSPDDTKKNRGFCFLEYETHEAALHSKRRLSSGCITAWRCDVIVDWADPQEEPDEETMSKVKVLYVRNLTQECTEENLKDVFESFGKVERVKKIKDYAFIHFEERERALEAMHDLNGSDMCGANIEVSLAKPPSDKKKKEEILKARERRMMQMAAQRGMPMLRGGRGGGPFPPPPPNTGYEYDYNFYNYGDYNGGYCDPYYDDYYSYGENNYYYPEYPQPPVVRGRGRAAPSGMRGRGVVNRGAGGIPRGGVAGRGGPGMGGRGSSGSGSRGMTPNRGRGGGFRGARGVGMGGTSGPGGEDGKRKFDGGMSNQGDPKRRYQSAGTGGWGNSYGGNLAGSEQQWYQDGFGQAWN